MRDVLRQLRACGFSILDRSPHLGFLYPGFWAVKKRNRRFLGAAPDVQRAIVRGHMSQGRDNGLLRAIMRLESRLRDRVYFPVGIRCLVTCARTLWSLAALLIYPAYNEASTIRDTVNKTIEYFSGHGFTYEIIVAADGNDGTREASPR